MHKTKIVLIAAVAIVLGGVFVYFFTLIWEKKGISQNEGAKSSMASPGYSDSGRNETAWKNYSNPFISFEYPSDFSIKNDKVISDHELHNGKDLYGYVGIILRNYKDDGLYDIGVLPRNSNVDDIELFNSDRKSFADQNVKSGDFFSEIIIDGRRASFQHLEFFEESRGSDESVSRLGSNKVNFSTEKFSYEIILSWSKLENNDMSSRLQKEFQEFLKSFHIVAQ